MSYFISGAMAIMVSFLLALTGCRFGNNKETVTTGVDTISGYYETLPQTLSFTVTDGTTPTTTPAPVNYLPLMAKTVMSNPMVLKVDNAATGEGWVADQTLTYGYRVVIDGNSKNFSGSSTYAQQLSTDCLESGGEVRTGSWTPFSTGTKMIGDLPAVGRVRMVQSKNWAWSGSECPQVALLYFDCWTHEDGCWGSTASDREEEHYSLRAIYDPAIDSGAMTAEQIKTVTALKYEASWQ